MAKSEIASRVVQQGRNSSSAIGVVCDTFQYGTCSGSRCFEQRDGHLSPRTTLELRCDVTVFNVVVENAYVSRYHFPILYTWQQGGKNLQICRGTIAAWDTINMLEKMKNHELHRYIKLDSAKH
jgi:hypothetical protein